MNKILWYLKQLLPLRYFSVYRKINGNKETVENVTWKMWFGKCYNIKTY